MKKAIWEAARETISEWTGQELTESSLYGIRIYEEGSVLMSHVDRLPLVSSAIINVAQDGKKMSADRLEVWTLSHLFLARNSRRTLASRSLWTRRQSLQRYNGTW